MLIYGCNLVSLQQETRFIKGVDTNKIHGQLLVSETSALVRWYFEIELDINWFVSFTDINECTTSDGISGHNCDANATCTNTDGSFTCVCNSGFYGDGFNCSGEGSTSQGKVSILYCLSNTHLI